MYISQEVLICGFISLNELLKKYKSYTFDFSDKKYSEIEFAKKISESANIKNFSSKLNEKEIPYYLEEVLNREYEPFSFLEY